MCVFLNIGPKYKDNIQLKPGRYHIEVSLFGYGLKTEWITLAAENKVHSVVLTALPKPSVAHYQSAANASSATKNRNVRQNGIAMAWVDSGCFQMSTGMRVNETKHRVCLSKGYYMGKYEVTQQFWL